MSAVETDTQPESVEQQREPLLREAPVELLPGGDGRTLIATFVPYNVVAEVRDRHTPRPYKERFLPGAFRGQLSAMQSRVKAFANYRHGQSIGDQLGAIKNVVETPEGLRGEIRLFNTPNGDTALEMFHEGLDKVSIEFASLRHRIVDGVTERLVARLLGVALTPYPTYEGAAVHAVRESLDVTGSLFEPLPPPDADVHATLRRHGVRLASD